MLKQKYFLTDFFILSAEKQPIKLSWRNIEWLQVEGIPEELLQSDNTHEDVTEDKPKRTTPHKGSIMVTTSKKHGTGRTHRKYTQTQAS